LREELAMEQGKRRFVVTEKGRKTGVLLSLKEYRELLEDLQDLAIIAERREEPSLPFDVVKEKLERRWRGTGSK
jgi:hypothetical protein